MAISRGRVAWWAALLLATAAVAPAIAAAAGEDGVTAGVRQATGDGGGGSDGGHDHDDHTHGDAGHDDEGHKDAATTLGASTSEADGADDHSGDHAGHDHGDEGHGEGHSDGAEGHDDGHSDGAEGHDDGDGGHDDHSGHGHGDDVHVGHDAPNPPLTTCLLPSAPGGPRNYSRCQSLPGQVPMNLYWDVDEAAGTLTAAYVAQSIGWAGFAFNAADEADQMLSGDPANPNVAVVGMVTGEDSASVGVYALRAKASAGVQPIGTSVYTGLVGGAG
eukprot:TRINITY_DN3153_c0_g1_i5.p2 TRINITY_DN3153_c0_g1~~TRINITY_DN3153_c0_g1_i5.p2  ORF type:complete len:275 (+),score=78.25 TRINITY_DN3153_c0_g1_i5:342-1166(+)